MSGERYYHGKSDAESRDSTDRKAKAEQPVRHEQLTTPVYAADQPAISLNGDHGRQSGSPVASKLHAESGAPHGGQTGSLDGLIRRKPATEGHCACGGGMTEEAGACSACQAKEITLQRRSGAGDHASPAIPASVHETLRSPGQPLDTSARAFMEPRFGQSFGHLRVHSDAKAAESARAINALAYTVGNHVAFGAGQYAPNTTSGKGLLAHELAHVAQQSSGRVNPVQRALALGAETDAHEREADRVAEQVLAGNGRPLLSLTPVNGLIQRTCHRPPLRGVNGCTRGAGDVRGEAFLFVRGCDDFRTDTGRPAARGMPGGEEGALRTLASGLSNGDTVELHGYASEEGDANYNEGLSCLRARRAQEVIANELRGRSVTVGFRLFMHGEVAGSPRAERRRVVVNLLRRPVSPPVPCVPTVVTGSTPSLIYTAGRAAAGRDAISGDFPSSLVLALPYAERTAVLNFLQLPRPLLLSILMAEMTWFSRAAAEGRTAILAFAFGQTGAILYGPGTNFSTKTSQSIPFLRAIRAASEAINAAIRAQATSCRIDYTTIRLPISSIPRIDFDRNRDDAALAAVIGGTQARWVSITNFTANPAARTYSATLSFDIYDVFGVDEIDIYSPGLTAFYVLQHFHTGHRPFVHRIVVETTVAGSY